MNDINILLEGLNPAKIKTDPTTWRSFYLKKGFSSFSTMQMKAVFIELLDGLLKSCAEFEYISPYEEEDLVSDEEAFLDIQTIHHKILHLFRAIMALSESSEACQEVLENILRSWSFDLWPEFSLDITGAVQLRPGEFESTLQVNLKNQVGEAPELLIKTNAIIAALNTGGRSCEFLKKILKEFHEFHPENIAFCMMCLYQNKPQDAELLQLIQLILEVEYVAYLDLDEKTFGFPESLRKVSPREWFQGKEITIQSLMDSFRWFGIQGRTEFLYFSLLGALFAGDGGIQLLFEDFIQDEDTVYLPGYSNTFVEFCQTKAILVQEDMAKRTFEATRYLESDEDGSLPAKARMFVIYIGCFLSSFPENQIQGDSFLRSLESFNDAWEHLGENEVKFIEAYKKTLSFWKNEYEGFCSRKAHLIQNSFAEPDFKKVLKEAGVVLR